MRLQGVMSQFSSHPGVVRLPNRLQAPLTATAMDLMPIQTEADYTAPRNIILVLYV